MTIIIPPSPLPRPGPGRRRGAVLLAVLLPVLGTLGGTTQGPPDAGISFVDVASAVGLTTRNVCGPPRPKKYIMETDGSGAGFVDYDRDGDLDVILVQGSTLARLAAGGDAMVVLYRNDGSGRFTEVTDGSGLTRRGWGFGVCAGDYDNDGWEDLYITALGANVLYRNLGNGTFRDVTEKAGVGDPRFSTGAAFADYDRDGHLDLYVANYVTLDLKNLPSPGSNPFCFYRGIAVNCGPRGLEGAPDTLYKNNGDGTFREVTAAAGIDPSRKLYGFAVIWADYDQDGDPDVYVANDSQPNLLWRNNGDGTFTDVGILSGAAVSEDAHEQAGMGAAFGDYDNDGRLDLLVTNFSDDYHTLYHNDDGGFFTDVSRRAGLGESTWNDLGWGTGFFDADHDGWKDIFFANGHVYPEVDEAAFGTRYAQRNQLFRNLGNGRFREVPPGPGSGLGLVLSSRGAAFGDYDNDGDVDILITNLNEPPSLLENRGGSRAGRWIQLRLRGEQSNRSAIGARVVVRSGSLSQTDEVRSGSSYLSQNDLRVHFGVGEAARVDELRIRWPSGKEEILSDLETNRAYLAEEGRGVRPVARTP